MYDANLAADTLAFTGEVIGNMVFWGTIIYLLMRPSAPKKTRVF